MATPVEILVLEETHRAAQARLGLAAAYLASIEWETVSELNADDTSAAWLLAALKVITAVRKMSRRLAVSYYQLSRALETGRTLGAPEGSTTSSVTLGELRKSFRDNAIDVASLPSTRTRSEDPDIRWFEEALEARESEDRSTRFPDVPVDPHIQRLMDVEESDDATRIPIDKYTWDKDLTFDQIDEAYRELLRKQAVEHSTRSVRRIRANEDLTPALALEQIEASHAAAGSLGAGTVDAAGIDAGRETIGTARRSDRLVKLIARGTSGDPCAFCAMLASRGFVFTGATSGVGDDPTGFVGDDIERYHTNCHCYPIIRWDRESQLPELNVYFKAKWKEEVWDMGFRDREARKKWRRWIYAQRKADPDAPHGIPINP